MSISGVSSVSSGYAASTLRPAGSAGTSGSSDVRDPSAQPQKKPGELSQAEKAQIKQLQERDREVRQHEMAHLAASGGLATSGAVYSFQVGPDGIAYAVGGEVSISMGPGRTPQETIARAETVRAAALAPADPSAQDLAVAAQAAKMEADARAELAILQSQKFDTGSKPRSSGADQYQQVADNVGAASGSIDVFA